MKSRGVGRLLGWIDTIMFIPGIDENILAMKKNVRLGSFGSGIAISGMTLLGYFLDLPVIVSYGFALLSLTIPALIILPFLKKNIDLIFFSIQFILIWITFFFMLRMGGLLTSAGLLFTGISIIFMSTTYQNNRLTIILFSTYITTLITTALLQPKLSPLPQMTPAKNLLFFTVNFTWQAGYTLLLIINNISQKKKLAEAKHAEALRLQELDEAKTRLFTNITHEFRTPLTIILGMARLIREKPEEWLEDGTEKIGNSGKNLLNLVNQMLDLAKLEAGAMPLHNFQQDIILQLRYLVDSFSSMAISRKIRLEFIPGTDHFLMDYDADKLMHILSNLLSNALKYNVDGNYAEVKAGPAGQGENDFVISVTDNGPGINPEHLPYIFDRFYRIEKDNGKQESGSGLGLTLTKELVRLMKGTISVSSLPDKGTTFTVCLPISNQALLRETAGFSDFRERWISESYLSGHERKTSSGRKGEESGRHILLIVEDSNDLVDYLEAVLRDDFLMEFAVNGKEGFDKALEFVPDIILSDVMMPEMDGITMLDKIRSDERTSHIPVVMLTAKADIASRLEGIGRGADAYMSKPFHEEELKLRLTKLIEQRNTLRQRYASMGVFTQSDDPTYKMEDAFMMKIRGIMEANLDNEDFGINQLCRGVGMSRAQLYRKFKSLMDKTVNEYLIQFRLYKANEMLKNTSLTASEIAWETGFKNLSHFSRVYRKMYGHSPGSHRN